MSNDVVVPIPLTTSAPVALLGTGAEQSMTESVLKEESEGSSINARLEAIVSMMRERVRPELDKKVQGEAAALLDLLPDIRSHHERLLSLVEIAVAALCTEKPNIVLAEDIRQRIYRRLHPSPVKGILRGGSPPALVILGLGTLLYLGIPFAMIYLPRIVTQKEVLGLDSSLLLLVGLAGALGSIVSIMVRIKDFEALKKSDPAVLFFTGFFKPVVGMSFALFIFTVLSSGLIPVTVAEEKVRHFFAALAFISGFSERFASDVASQAEKAVITPQ